MKSIYLALAVVLTFFVAIPQGHSQYLNGEELNGLCSSGSPMEEGICLGYIAGVHNSGRRVDPSDSDVDRPKTSWNGATACPPGMSGPQLKEVVTEWLQKHHEDWHFNAAELVVRAIAETWQCLD